MKWLSQKTVKKLKTLQVSGYRNLKIWDEDTLLKINITKGERNYILPFLGKRVEKAILPQKIYRVFPSFEYAYTENFAKGFEDFSYFSQYERKYSNKEILQFFKSMLLTLENLHKEHIYSGDFWYKNLLINPDLDYRFIDFSGVQVPRYIEEYSPKSLFFLPRTGQYIISDKISLLLMILNAMVYGHFVEQDTKLLPEQFDFQKFGLSKEATTYLKNLATFQEIPTQQEYFIEIIEEFIEREELPYRMRKGERK